MPKILYVATVVKTHILEFHVPYLKMLKEMGWETAVAARNDFEDPSDCVIPYCDSFYDIPFERNPVNQRNNIAYKELKKVIDDGGYDIIHCHTPVGAMLTRIAAKDARKKGCKVIYTAHGFHFYKGAPLVNWLLYYPVEKLLAKKTDVLVTINTEDYQRAQKFKAGKTVYVPGVGIDIGKFSRTEGIREKKRSELGIPLDAKVLLSVGELNVNKNHKVVINALPDMKNCWYVVCGRGPLMDNYKKLASDLGVSDRVLLAGYRTDVSEFYQMADVFVFPSFREGLPVALMEAMASGLPCVAARNRGTDDLLNGSEMLFDATNLEELKHDLKVALSSEGKKEVLRNKEHLLQFDINNTTEKIKDIYLSVLGK